MSGINFVVHFHLLFIVLLFRLFDFLDWVFFLLFYFIPFKIKFRMFMICFFPTVFII